MPSPARSSPLVPSSTSAAVAEPPMPVRSAVTVRPALARLVATSNGVMSRRTTCVSSTVSGKAVPLPARPAPSAERVLRGEG